MVSDRALASANGPMAANTVVTGVTGCAWVRVFTWIEGRGRGTTVLGSSIGGMGGVS